MHDLESPVTWATIHYFEGENVVGEYLQNGIINGYNSSNNIS